jgi:membrane fusion protein
MSTQRLDQSAGTILATGLTLFRSESLQEQQLVWLGRHRLVLGLPASLFTVVSFAMTMATVALLTIGSYARRVDVHGVLMPAHGLIQITTPITGWIEAIRVQDGQLVQSGTPLYVVNGDTTTADGDTQQQVLQALAVQRSMLVYQIARKVKMHGQQQDELQRKAGNLQEQIQQMGIQVATKEQFVRDVTKNYADFSRFLANGIGNINEQLIQQQNWMRAKDDLEELKGRALRLQAELIETQFQLSTVDLQYDNEIDAMRSKIWDVEQEVAKAQAHRSVEIRAPGPGTVTAIASHAGQTVASGTRMLTIVPSQDKMHAELLAPSTSIGFIHPGQRVLLRYTAFPYQKFGRYEGTVSEVSSAALQPEELKIFIPNLPSADQSKTFYRVIVEPDREDVTAYGHSNPLKASMQVEADILLEKRAIYQWILEPLYSLHGV